MSKVHRNPLPNIYKQLLLTRGKAAMSKQSNFTFRSLNIMVIYRGPGFNPHSQYHVVSLSKTN